MEVLNNIWTAISTPNEGLVDILLIPAGILENLLIMYLFICILNISCTKKQKIMYVMLMSCTSLLSMYIIPEPFNIFFNYLMMFGLTFLIFKLGLVL